MLGNKQTTKNIQAQSTVDIDDSKSIVAFMSASLNRDNNISITINIGNRELFELHKTEVTNDINEFLESAYNI